VNRVDNKVITLRTLDGTQRLQQLRGSEQLRTVGQQRAQAEMKLVAQGGAVRTPGQSAKSLQLSLPQLSTVKSVANVNITPSLPSGPKQTGGQVLGNGQQGGFGRSAGTPNGGSLQTGTGNRTGSLQTTTGQQGGSVKSGGAQSGGVQTGGQQTG